MSNRTERDHELENECMGETKQTVKTYIQRERDKEREIKRERDKERERPRATSKSNKQRLDVKHSQHQRHFVPSP
jgi:hypothetical protein